MDLKEGTWIDGRYKILRLLGKGREGSVYLAFQEKVFRFYAVKEIEKEGICFSRESVEVWKTLHLRGLPEIVDILETKDKIYLVTEYIEGKTLQYELEHREDLSAYLAADWCLQIIEILEYLHSQEPPIAYGDLKPDNLILQNKKMFLVDMGSLIRQGSAGKITGTRTYSLSEQNPQLHNAQIRDCYSLGKLMKLLSDKCRSKQLKKLAEQLMDSAVKGKTGSLKKARKKLKRMKKQPWVCACLFLFTACLLAEGQMKWEEQQNQKRETQSYENQMSLIRDKNGKEKQEALLELIADRPEEKEAYLELLSFFREDMRLDEEEELCYRQLWKEIRNEKGETCEQLLRKNPGSWQEVAYESGITYWYFYKGLSAKQDAAVWFQKVTEISPENCSDTQLWEKSNIYRKLGEYQKKWKTYDETGEKREIFRDYWEETGKLLAVDTQMGSMIRLMLWKETLSCWKHYLVELKEEGIQKAEIEKLLHQLSLEIRQIPEQRFRMQELADQLKKDTDEIEKIMERVYQGAENKKMEEKD